MPLNSSTFLLLAVVLILTFLQVECEAAPCSSVSADLKKDYDTCQTERSSAQLTYVNLLKELCSESDGDTGILVAFIAVFGIGIGFSGYLGYLEKKGKPMFGVPPEPSVREGELTAI